MRIHILILGYNGLIPSSRPKIDTVFRVQSQKFSLAFDKLNEIEKRSMKFKAVRIHKVLFSVCCPPEILLRWQRDVTISLF